MVLLNANWAAKDGSHAIVSGEGSQSVEPGGVASIPEFHSSDFRSSDANDVVLRVVDAGTGEPLSNVEVVVEREAELAEVTLTTSNDGALSIPSNSILIRPADGYSFQDCLVPVVRNGDNIEVTGQFRIKCSGLDGAKCFLGKDRGKEEWRKQLRVMSASDGEANFEGLEDVGIVGGKSWSILKTRPGWYCIVVPEATIAPGHRLWTGKVYESEEDGVSAQRVVAPMFSGPVIVSMPFKAKAGADIEYQLARLVEKSTITLSLERSGRSGKASLIRRRSIAGSKHEKWAKEYEVEFDVSANEVVFNDIEYGTYQISCVSLEGKRLLISNQSLVVELPVHGVSELTGRGPYSLAINVPDNNLLIASVGCIDRTNSVLLVPTDVMLNSIDMIEGIMTQEFELYWTESEAFFVRSFPVDLSKVAALLEVPK